LPLITVEEDKAFSLAQCKKGQREAITDVHISANKTERKAMKRGKMHIPYGANKLHPFYFCQ